MENRHIILYPLLIYMPMRTHSKQVFYYILFILKNNYWNRTFFLDINKKKGYIAPYILKYSLRTF